jgi:hypothetical protein
LMSAAWTRSRAELSRATGARGFTKLPRSRLSLKAVTLEENSVISN